MNDFRYIGIDFGTTNCCVAYTQYHARHGHTTEPTIIEIRGRPTVQNVLLFSPEDHSLVAFGEEVYEAQGHLQYPESVYREYKLRLGEDAGAQRCAETMFAQLYHAVIRSLNVDRLDPEHHQVVIGVPAQWDQREVQSVLTSAAEGGFGDASPVPEPLGTMLYHAYRGDISFQSRPEFDLVIDFGGGTTDFVVLQMAQHWPTPREVHVYGERYGGRDFDLVLLDYIRRTFWRGYNWHPRLEVQLEMFARRFKERFSTAVARGAPSYEQMCGLPRFEPFISLSRSEFESSDVAGPLLERFSIVLERGLSESRLAPQEFRRIILSGGSSRWYFVEEKLRRVFPEALIVRSPTPEQTIAKGLTLYFVDPTITLSKPQSQMEHEPIHDKRTEFYALREQVISQTSEPAIQIHPSHGQPASPLIPVEAPPLEPLGVKRTHYLDSAAKWGLLLLFLLLLDDLFVPVLGGSPMMPELTCLCGLPLFCTALLIAFLVDRRN